MTKKFIAGGCSFTFGHELSDDVNGQYPSKKTWAYGLKPDSHEYVCCAYPGSGNQGIARRVFGAINQHEDVDQVVVMWSLLSRYDWAMDKHKTLEDKRWATISAWDTPEKADYAKTKLGEDPVQAELWKKRQQDLVDSGVSQLAESLYRFGANQYHEIYLSWKSIIWLQNLLEKKKIKYMFTCADNSLFYQGLAHHKNLDWLMQALHDEIDFDKWFFFGNNCMGFKQWSSINRYQFGTAHPLDNAHTDAVKYMMPTFKKIMETQNV